MLDEHKLRSALADNVPPLRQAQGLSQQDLADRIGASRVTVNRIENGRLIPGADLLYALADALGVSTDRLRQVSNNLAKI